MNASPRAADNTAPIAPAVAAPRWSLDAGHSAVGFSVRHLMITKVRGEFESFRGDVAYDGAHPEATRISAAIDVASLSSRDAKRDADLRSPLFFDAENHPEMTFIRRSAAAGRATASSRSQPTSPSAVRPTK